MNYKFNFYEDPGHGWLEVPVSLCREFGLKVTGYSYAKGDNLYLEEDCDMSAFVDAFESKTGLSWRNMDSLNPDTRYPYMVQHRTNHSSPIRSYLDSIPGDLLRS